MQAKKITPITPPKMEVINNKDIHLVKFLLYWQVRYNRRLEGKKDKLSIRKLAQRVKMAKAMLQDGTVRGSKVAKDYWKELGQFDIVKVIVLGILDRACLLYTSPSPRDATLSRMPSSA